MARRLLSGGEAVAHAALSAGAAVIAGYPTDSLSQLIESALRQVQKGNANGSHAQWTVNDKTTLGLCGAASLTGLRALAAFSQTGFSETIQGIAALSHAGILGGLAVVVADEPASDAFTANLDVRRISELAKIPVIDPATPEQAYTAVSAAFILSERYSTPVVIHIAQDVNFTSTFFDIHPHTKASGRKGSFLKNKESLDVNDLVLEDPQDFSDISDGNISDIDVRLKEIAYRFSYKENYTTYNRTFEFEQQFEGKHNSRRFKQGDQALSNPAKKQASAKSLDPDKTVPLSLNSRETQTDSPENTIPLDESNIKLGICVCGAAVPYAVEAIETLREEAHKSRVSTPYIRLLTLGTPFPVPKRTLRRFLDGLNDILVIEEFSSFAEEELIKQCATSFLGPSVHGRFTDEVNYNYPVNFETTIMHIAAFIDKCLNVKPEKVELEGGPGDSLSPITNMGKHSSPSDGAKNLTPRQSRTLTGIARRLANPESIYTYNYDIPERPPVLCAGCPHRSSFYILERALERLKVPRGDVIVSGDVGCTLLGNNPPMSFLDAYLGEGYSASLAQGFALTSPAPIETGKSIAILGDSSFFANAVPAITNAVVNDIDLTVIVLDNKTCAESGLQPTPTSFGMADVAQVLRSLGIQNVREADPFDASNALDSCVKALREERPSAVVLSSKCARLTHSEKSAYINVNKCTGCRECIVQLGCPAISFDRDIVGRKSGTLGQAVIDVNQCNGCRLCFQVCPDEAIRIMQHKDVVDLMRKERRAALSGASGEESLEGESPTDVRGDGESQAESQAEPFVGSFDSGTLYVAEDEETVEERASSTKEALANGSPKKRVSKEYSQVDFDTLFGGKNAELRVNDEPEAETMLSITEASDVSAQDDEADGVAPEETDEDALEEAVEEELEEEAFEDELAEELADAELESEQLAEENGATAPKPIDPDDDSPISADKEDGDEK